MSKLSEVKNSLKFFSICRENLVSIIKEIETLTESEKKDVITFLENYATDYEILSLTINNKLPKERSNIIKEQKLIQKYKNNIMENYDVLNKVIKEDYLNEFILEFDSVMPYGLSSAKPIMEFNKLSGIMNENIIVEREKMFWNNILTEQSNVDVARRAAKVVKGVYDKSGPVDAARVATGGARLMAALHKIGVSSGAANVGAKVGAGSIASGAGAVVLGGAAIAALLAWAAKKTFNRFFSAAAKQCNQYSGSQKTACMIKAKRDAFAKQIQDLKAGAVGCAKTKNPDACNASITKKIAKLQLQMSKVK